MAKNKLTFSQDAYTKLLKQNSQLTPDTRFNQPNESINPIAKLLTVENKTVDGLLFDSQLEARRYAVLKLWVKAGLITDLTTQHEDQGKGEEKQRNHWWNLSQTYTNGKGKSIRAQFYVDDFQYRIKGILIVEDVKGWARPLFINKMKILETTYPNINFFLNYDVQGWYPILYQHKWKQLCLTQ